MSFDVEKAERWSKEFVPLWEEPQGGQPQMEVSTGGPVASATVPNPTSASRDTWARSASATDNLPFVPASPPDPAGVGARLGSFLKAKPGWAIGVSLAVVALGAGAAVAANRSDETPEVKVAPPSPAIAAAPPPPPPEPEPVLPQIHLDVRPAGATVLLDGEAVTVPYDGEVSAGEHRVEATLDGFRPFVRTYRVERNRRFIVTMQRERAVRPRHRGRRRLATTIGRRRRR